MAEGGKQLQLSSVINLIAIIGSDIKREGGREGGKEGGRKDTGKERERGMHKHAQIVKHNRNFKIHNLNFA